MSTRTGGRRWAAIREAVLRRATRTVVTYEPRPTDRRTTAEQLEVGDTVFVWAHDTPHLAAPCPHDMWRYGTVVDLDHATSGEVYRPLQITLHDGQVVHTVLHAVAYVVAADVITRPRPGDDPQPPAEPVERVTERSIKVAAIRPGMDVTVDATGEVSLDTRTGRWAARPTPQGVRVHGRVRSCSKTGDLVQLVLDVDHAERRVHAHARHAAVLHVDVDEPYDQTQEA